MNSTTLNPLTFWLLLLSGVAAPVLFPDYTNQLAVLWLMIVFASTWDILGGQMGYNSLGNIFFFGAGMYVAAVVQIGLFYDVGMYTSGARTTHIVFTHAQYFTGFALGTVAGGIAAALLAVAVGWIFGCRQMSVATCRPCGERADTRPASAAKCSAATRVASPSGDKAAY